MFRYCLLRSMTAWCEPDGRTFQRVAHGQFTIRRLERGYGPTVVRHHYEALFSQ